MRPLFSLAEAAKAAEAVMRQGNPRAPVAGVSVDSRTISAWDLFFALKGERTDGHLFVADAAAKGATGAVVAALPACLLPSGFGIIEAKDPLLALGRLARVHLDRVKPKIKIGVTGSVGKTTTKEMIARVLSVRYRTVVSEANYNTEIGVPLTAFRVADGDEACVFEMAMRGPGQIRYLCGIVRPGIGVITNIGPTHMELLGSQEAIARAKAELLESLPGDGVAVLNLEDPWSVKVGDGFPGRRIFFSASCLPSSAMRAGDELVLAKSVDAGRQCVSFSLALLDGGGTSAVGRVTLRVPGLHNVRNALAAAAAGVAAGLSVEEIAAGLEGFEGGPMRLWVSTVCGGRLTLIDDAYNSSPASAKAALEVLSSFGRARKVAVLGDMLELGPYERTGHLEVGRAVADAGVSLLMTVGKASRMIGEAAASSASPPSCVYHCEDNRAAVEILRKELQPGDVVLVKGSRAMHMEEIVRELKELQL